MPTKHKLIACIPHGDPDLGAEIECELAFSFTSGSADYWNKAAGMWEQGWPAEIEFVSAAPMCNGKPAPFLDYPDQQQATLNDLAEQWLESDRGRHEAFETVWSDDERAREYAAELRADR